MLACCYTTIYLEFLFYKDEEIAPQALAPIEAFSSSDKLLLKAL
jgi:hypothetical protein